MNRTTYLPKHATPWEDVYTGFALAQVAHALAPPGKPPPLLAFVNMGWCATDAEDFNRRKTDGDGWLDEADGKSPSGRLLRPEDTMASVVHLLSDASSMVTGAILDISPDAIPGIMPF